MTTSTPVYITVHYSLTDSQDLSISGAYNSIEKAMEYCIKEAQGLDSTLKPEDIKTHGIRVPGHPFKITRIPPPICFNLGSNYGVTFKLTHNGQHRAAIIVKRDVD